MNRQLTLSSPAALGAAVLIVTGLCVAPAQAGYMVILDLVSNTEAVASGSGEIDLTGLTFLEVDAHVPLSVVFPARGLIGSGPTGDLTYELFTGLKGPTSCGPLPVSIPAVSGSGTPVFISGSGIVPKSQ